MMKKQKTKISKKPTLLFLTFLLAVSILVMQKGTLSQAASTYDVPAGTTSFDTADIPKDAQIVNIPASVTKIWYSGDDGYDYDDEEDEEYYEENEARREEFHPSAKLKAINVASNNPNYASENGILYNKDKTVLICYPPCKTDKTYTMPKTLQRAQNPLVSFSSTLPSYIKTLNISEGFTTLGYNHSTWTKSIYTEDSFEAWPGLEAINVDSKNKKFASVKGVLYNKKKTVLICYPPSKKGKTYAMPKTVKTMRVYSFTGQKYVEKVVMSDKITTLPIASFCSCRKLKSIHLSKKLKYISAYSLAYCPKLKSLTFPANCRFACLPSGNKSLKTLKIDSKKITLSARDVGEYALQIKKGTACVLDVGWDDATMTCKPKNILSIKKTRWKDGKNYYYGNKITAKKTGTATLTIPYVGKLKIKVVK